jgi:hypothetical protein
MENTKASRTSNKILEKDKNNIPYIILIILAFALLGYQYYKYYQLQNPEPNTKSAFANIAPPYIAQSVFINIYATPVDYPKYQMLFKGTLLNSIRVSSNIKNPKAEYVMVPKTVVNIPINVFNNASKTRFTIQANGIEQEIQACDFIGTTF